MVKCCNVGDCGNSNLNVDKCASIFERPVLIQKWDAFVRSARKDWKTDNHSTIICDRHIKVPDDF